MKTVERIKKAFEFLQKDCSSVALIGFVEKENIPSSAIREDEVDENFDHEYIELIHTVSNKFVGEIYLQLIDDTYMIFEVNG